MTKPTKSIPKFKTEAQERRFWESAGRDSTQYLDWSTAQRAVFPNLKPSTKTISLRLPEHLLDAIKSAANSRDVPYQSLIKVWLQERVDRDYSPAASTVFASRLGISRASFGTRKPGNASAMAVTSSLPRASLTSK